MFGREKTITITFTNRTIVRVVVIAALSVLGLALLGKIAHALTLIFIAFFLAIALNPAVSWIARHFKRESRVHATGIAYIIVVLLLAGFLALIVPPLVRQTNTFARNLPANVEHYTNKDSSLMRFVRDHHLEDEINQATNKLKDNLDNIGGSIISTAGRAWGVVLSTLAVLVMTFMMLVEGPYWLERFWAMQDPTQLEKRKHVAQRMYRVITRYVNGQLLIALIAGFFALIALLISSTLLNESINAVVYALIITLTGLIPMFGNLLGAIIVVILCAFTSLPLAIIMGIFFLVYQQIENSTIQPHIQAKQNELTPLLVFIAALIGISFGGILGAFVAIPVAGCIRVFITEFYGHKLNFRTKKSKA